MDETEALKKRVVKLEAALQDIADHGIQVDCNPTLHEGNSKNGYFDPFWVYQYLTDADAGIRKAARSALRHINLGDKVKKISTSREGIVVVIDPYETYLCRTDDGMLFPADEDELELIEGK